MNIALLIAGGSGARSIRISLNSFFTVNERPVVVYTLESVPASPGDR